MIAPSPSDPACLTLAPTLACGFDPGRGRADGSGSGSGRTVPSMPAMPVGDVGDEAEAEAVAVAEAAGGETSDEWWLEWCDNCW